MPHYTFSVTRRHALDTVGDVLTATTETAALAEADTRLTAEVGGWCAWVARCDPDGRVLAEWSRTCDRATWALSL